MDLRWTEEQKMMRKMVREFARTEITPMWSRWMKKSVFPGNFKKDGPNGTDGYPYS